MKPLSGFSLTPKQMSLSDLEWSFCVKMCLELGENCTEICRAAHILPAAKMWPRDCTGDIRVMELFTGINEQEASNQCTVITLTVTVLTHVVH